MLDEMKAVRQCLAEVRTLLISPSPDDVNRCVPLLQEAITRMQTIRPAVGIADELTALRFELGVASRMAAGGAAFYAGWMKILALSAGYMPSGEPAPLAAAGSVSVRG